MSQNSDDSIQEHEQTNPIIKILYEQGKLFILDMMGQVQIIDLKEKKATKFAMESPMTFCIDINVT